MKHLFQPMARPRKTLTLAGIALLLVSTAGSLPAAQSIDPTTGAVVFEAEPVRFEPEVEEHRLDVDFDGLILDDIVKYLREVPAFRKVNFVVSPKVMNFGQEAAIFVKLRAAGLSDILSAIGIATDDRATFELRTPTLVAVIPGQTWQPTPEPAPATPSSPPPAYQVVNLQDVLRQKDPDVMDKIILEIRDLVSQTLQTIHGNTSLAPKLNYHQGSGILVIVGQPDAIKITMDIIRNLRFQEPQP
jgi:hypothetical protein